MQSPDSQSITPENNPKMSSSTRHPDYLGLPFIEKMWIMVNTEEHIGWGPLGSSFVIKNIAEFSKNVLPRYFKHNNYSSFVRQLNMYGFHKNKADLSLNEFSHRFFRRDNKQLSSLSNIPSLLWSSLISNILKQRRQLSTNIQRKGLTNALEEQPRSAQPESTVASRRRSPFLRVSSNLRREDSKSSHKETNQVEDPEDEELDQGKRPMADGDDYGSEKEQPSTAIKKNKKDSADIRDHDEPQMRRIVEPHILMNRLQQENETLKEELLRLNMEKTIMTIKIQKFLTSLSAELINLELSHDPENHNREAIQRLSVETISSLMDHMTCMQRPFDYDVYEKYAKCVLYLVPLAERNRRLESQRLGFQLRKDSNSDKSGENEAPGWRKRTRENIIVVRSNE